MFRMFLMFLFEVIILPITGLSLIMLWFGALAIVLSLFMLLFASFKIAFTIWLVGFASAALGGALFLGKTKISTLIAVGRG